MTPMNAARHTELVKLARRALTHLQQGTTDQAADIMRMPVAAYTDAHRYGQEIDVVFGRLPIAVAASLEVPRAGSYLAYSVLGRPLLIVRGKDERVRVFLNACRHRGAPVCAPGSGSSTRFTCPYHAWSYDTQGRLVGVHARATFGEFDHETHGLTELPTAERAGIVWACLTPGLSFDIDAWLGAFAVELDSVGLTHWHVYQAREFPGPGWKVTMDGYLEVYHHDSVHGRTVGPHTIGNLLVHDVFGMHQRLVFGRRNLAELAQIPESDWQPERHLRLVQSGFPNLSISAVVGGFCMVNLIFPGAGPDATVTRQVILSADPLNDPTVREAAERFSAMALQALCEEDYPIGFRIQAGLASGANTEFMFGRNEPAVQQYHRNIMRCVARAARGT